MTEDLYKHLYKQYSTCPIPCKLNGKEFDLTFWKIATVLYQPGHPFWDLGSEFKEITESNKYSFDFFKTDLKINIKFIDQKFLSDELAKHFLEDNVPNFSDTNVRHRISPCFHTNLSIQEDAQQIAKIAGKLLADFYFTKHNKKNKQIPVIERVEPGMTTPTVTLESDLEWFRREVTAKSRISNFTYQKGNLLNALNYDRTSRRGLKELTPKSPEWTTFWAAIQERQQEFQITIKRRKDTEYVRFQPEQNQSRLPKEAKELLEQPLNNGPNTWEALFDQHFEIMSEDDPVGKGLRVEQFEEQFRLLNGATTLQNPTKRNLMNLRKVKGFGPVGHGKERLNVKRKSTDTPEQVDLLKYRRLCKELCDIIQRKEIPTEKSQPVEPYLEPTSQDRVNVPSTVKGFKIFWWDCLQRIEIRRHLDFWTLLFDIINTGVPDPLENIDENDLMSKLTQEELRAIQTFIFWNMSPVECSNLWENSRQVTGSSKLMKISSSMSQLNPIYLHSTYLWLIAGFAFHHMDRFKDPTALIHRCEGFPCYKDFSSFYQPIHDDQAPVIIPAMQINSLSFQMEDLAPEERMVDPNNNTNLLENVDESNDRYISHSK